MKSYNTSSYNTSIFLFDAHKPANILPFPKKYRKIEYQWDDIPRANNPKKTLSEKALKILANAVNRLNHNDVITFTHSYLSNLTKCKYDQNNNLLRELSAILDIKFHRSVVIKGKKYRDRFSVSYTKNGKEILENPNLFYPEKSAEDSDKSPKKFGHVSEKIRTANIRIIRNDNKELDNITSEVINARAREENFTPIETNLSNFCKNSFENFSKTEITPLQESEQLVSRSSRLNDFYPLTQSDCDELQLISKREFSLNAMNEILCDISKRLPDRTFKNRPAFMQYFGKLLSWEKRNSHLTNNIGFRIKNNLSKEEVEFRENEKYLTGIENNQNVTPEWQLRKKIAIHFNQAKACEFLRACRWLVLEKKILKIYLSKNVELSLFLERIILHQAGITYGYFDSTSLEGYSVEEVQIIMPSMFYNTNKNSEKPYEKPMKEEIKLDRNVMLKGLIAKSFSPLMVQKIESGCHFTEIEPGKIGIRLEKDMNFHNSEREILRNCIKQAYGSDVKMVKATALDISKPSKDLTNTEVFQPRVETSPPETHLALIDQFMQKFEEYLQKIRKVDETTLIMFVKLFEGAKVIENVTQKTIIFNGNKEYNAMRANCIKEKRELANAVKYVLNELGITIELHVENGIHKYNPEGKRE